jgi:hypothetical protein
VYIDHDQAVILDHEFDGTEAIEILTRDATETEAAFEGRTVDEVLDHDRVVVSGPAFARTEFERAYVSVTHRPDRIVDREPATIRHRRTGRAS